jgi:hypothetical protein
MSKLADAVNNLADEIEMAEQAIKFGPSTVPRDVLISLIAAAENVIDSWEN